ncbi:TIGR04282 family arsenosugar biosynthesis glycosyltransferase [Novilysobacter antarcticus]|uniref:TIGR04282 family arsenosugar biosynthesis glycosyltransferase n=1 Tax=Novilysobacter antarcticus TaxID=2862543 RepID=UPI0031BA6CF6
MSGALAIFVKTPGRSALKTRLAGGTGDAYAQRWYALAADAVASVATRAREDFGITAYWAVAEAGAESEWTGLPTIAQGEGDLGTRMARVHAELVERHGFAVLIGADAPQLTATLIGQAADWLAAPGATEPRLSLGPASDGGFWLFGSNRVVPLPAWVQVRYSQADTASRFSESMRIYGRWQTLAALTDVDRAEDLKRVQQALDALAEPTAAQRTLAQWMHETSPVPHTDGNP